MKRITIAKVKKLVKQEKFKLLSKWFFSINIREEGNEIELIGYHDKVEKIDYKHFKFSFSGSEGDFFNYNFDNIIITLTKDKTKNHKLK